MLCFAAEVAAFPGMEGLISAKSVRASSGEMLFGTSLGKMHLHISGKASVYVWSY